MSALSKGSFSVDRIEKMEICIIETLQWRLNPPTPNILLNIASPIIDASSGIHEHNDPQIPYEILELSRYLLELSVCDGFFIDKKQSSIAYASILVAMDYLETCANAKEKIARHFCFVELDIRCVQQIHYLISEAESEMDVCRTSSPNFVHL